MFNFYQQCLFYFYGLLKYVEDIEDALQNEDKHDDIYFLSISKRITSNEWKTVQHIEAITVCVIPTWLLYVRKKCKSFF